MTEPVRGTLHHVELWVPDIGRAVRSWGWLLGELGYRELEAWAGGLGPRADADGSEVELVAR